MRVSIRPREFVPYYSNVSGSRSIGIQTFGWDSLNSLCLLPPVVTGTNRRTGSFAFSIISTCRQFITLVDGCSSAGLSFLSDEEINLGREQQPQSCHPHWLLELYINVPTNINSITRLDLESNPIPIRPFLIERFYIHRQTSYCRLRSSWTDADWRKIFNFCLIFHFNTMFSMCKKRVLLFFYPLLFSSTLESMLH